MTEPDCHQYSSGSANLQSKCIANLAASRPLAHRVSWCKLLVHLIGEDGENDCAPHSGKYAHPEFPPVFRKGVRLSVVPLVLVAGASTSSHANNKLSKSIANLIAKLNERMSLEIDPIQLVLLAQWRRGP